MSALKRSAPGVPDTGAVAALTMTVRIKMPGDFLET